MDTQKKAVPVKFRFVPVLLCAVLAMLILPSAQPVQGKSRGIVVQTREGKPIDLYGGSHALVIGNGAYKEWDPLPGAIRDVKDVARALKKNGFQVTLKENLTRAGFESAVTDFFLNYGRNPDNRLLIYYAGHGYTEKMGNGEEMGYLVMVDSPVPEKDPAGFYMNNIDMQYIVNRAKYMRARHVLFMFDSCFSGSVLNLRERVTPEHISENIALPVREFITAGRADEPVPDYSYFKQAFLDLLEGRDREPVPDGYITGEELGLYLKTKVPQYNKAQHPQFGKIRDPRMDKGDFVFVVAEESTGEESRALLNVRSAVRGARVLVDGKEEGRTPLTGLELAPGEHRVRVERTGYETYEKKVHLRSGRKVSLFADLKPAGPRRGRLFLETTPEEARVRIMNIVPVFEQGMELDPGVTRWR